MFYNKKDHKKRHPYMGIALFSLAATGVVSIISKGKRFIKEKTASVTNMMKEMKN